ncbi:hypothetical protein GCM10023346_13820 [Arthrobacter gyeryongensis]|uniref:Transposase n=1 Tax=Arthrobacter gyeryongensis TaxID=1650592 RepID=A0ABP9S775_9MICC
MVPVGLNEACFVSQTDVDRLSPRMLGIDERRFRSVRYFQESESKTWTRFEPWMTTIVDLDTGQVLGVMDSRDHKCVKEWLFARPLEWRWRFRSLRSTRRRRSARRCACDFHPRRSITST